MNTTQIILLIVFAVIATPLTILLSWKLLKYAWKKYIVGIIWEKVIFKFILYVKPELTDFYNLFKWLGNSKK